MAFRIKVLLDELFTVLIPPSVRRVARVVGEILPEVGTICADIWLSSYKVLPDGAGNEPKAGP